MAAWADITNAVTGVFMTWPELRDLHGLANGQREEAEYRHLCRQLGGPELQQWRDEWRTSVLGGRGRGERPAQRRPRGRPPAKGKGRAGGAGGQRATANAHETELHFM